MKSPSIEGLIFIIQTPRQSSRCVACNLHIQTQPYPMLVYQIQDEVTLDHVVQASVDGKEDVQQLLMNYRKQKS